MGNDESKPENLHVFEPVVDFFERLSQDVTDCISVNQKEEKPPKPTYNHRSVKKSSDGFDLRKKLQNTRIGEKDLAAFTPPEFEKSNEENYFLWDMIRKNFILNDLDDTELRSVLYAFEKVEFDTNEIIFKQGEVGNYFFVLYSGECIVNIDGNDEDDYGPGDGFGELALLYSSPRFATVTATTPTICFRIDKRSFRYLLLSQKQRTNSEKLELLRKIDFLKDLEVSQIHRLSSAMTVKCLKKGEYYARKGDPSRNEFVVVYEGEIKFADITLGDAEIGDVVLGRGAHFGERTIFTGLPHIANGIAITDVTLFSIDGDTFKTVLGDLELLILRSRDKLMLKGVECIKESYLDSSTLDILAGLIEDETFSAGTTIMTEGESYEPAIYIVRKGKCEVTTKDGTRDETIDVYGSIGADQFTSDVGKQSRLKDGDDEVVAGYTVVAVEDTNCGILKLKDCRAVFDTSLIGQGQPIRRKSQIEKALQLDDLSRHSILGEGSFGQVWLVSTKNGQGEEMPYAMKIQSKFQLVQSGQATGVVNEMEIMTQLHHPFVLPLIKTFQDQHFIYMLFGVLQGGELLYRMYTDISGGMPENEAKFYAAGILEALAYIHRKQIIHRDLKPENVLLDNQGYPVIVDFGFAKHVPDKTYTFCGTPLYIAPEIILNKGHNFAADNWSLGCLIYEMLCGESPFFEPGMEQLELYKKICRGQFRIQPLMKHKQALDLVLQILVVQYWKRLGSLARGQRDMFQHEWFAEIDFSVLRNKEIEAPWIPTLKNVLDTSNFPVCNKSKDKMGENFPVITDEDQELFELFGVI